MSPRRRTETAGARTRLAVVVGLLMVIGAPLGVVGHATWPHRSVVATTPVAPTPAQARPLDLSHKAPGGQVSGPLGSADGEVPDGVTVFNDRLPAVTNLDPVLLAALRAAATEAKRDDVQLVVNSGWRSRSYQTQLLKEAVRTYGSRKQAARWVATPSTSPHVSGDAVDLGPSSADAWLSEHGAAYGLCQIYLNEPWHYELRTEAKDHGCPTPYADPTHDPRMQ